MIVFFLQACAFCRCIHRNVMTLFTPYAQQHSELKLREELEAAAVERHRLADAVSQKAADLHRQEQAKLKLEAELEQQRQVHGDCCTWPPQ